MNILDRFDNANEYSNKYYNEEKMTQKEACLDYLERYGSITPLEALSAFNSMRLASIICRLRKEGYPIRKETNKNGKPYAIYYLMGVENDG